MRRVIPIVLATLLAGACARPPVPEGASPGQAVYLSQCAVCHGVVGEGTSGGPPLTDVPVGAPGTVDPAFRSAVLEGINENPDFGAMPAFPLSDEDLLAVADHLRELGAPTG